MPMFITDKRNNKILLYAPNRSFRPQEKRKEKGEIKQKEGFSYVSNCPFCFGNEKDTPPEIDRIIKEEKNATWQVRVIPNKYPLTKIHEVIIHSPDHNKDISDFSLEQVENLILSYQRRYLANFNYGRVLIFNNKGHEAGESLIHPHSQLTVLPQEVKMQELEIQPVSNLILESECFNLYCPKFSEWSYESWITRKINPKNKKTEADFRFFNKAERQDLAFVLQKIIKILRKKFPDLSYNYYISSKAPFYLRVIPRLIKKAGFELATGWAVNTIDPSIAARELSES